ncbi:hypothetical protein [Embleya sp. NBC_00896]|uniref:hypothetical protein n=1 Tax=Embleya sp. NBC_00896 TaxID=2975961 RepID=UPI00386C4446|nr:hypothetical protein OG928_29825 [Embleya sp. NBC_00896]
MTDPHAPRALTDEQTVLVERLADHIEQETPGTPDGRLAPMGDLVQQVLST